MPQSNFSKTIALCLGVLAMIFVLNYLVLAWTEPSASPPASNVSAPINVGSTGQSKSGGLILNTGGAATGLAVATGSVGIGTLSPSGRFHVSGTGDILLNATGSVGIGTDIPSQKLEVNGNGLFTGDVCNGTGLCLSSIFQTNVMSGTNPTCPVGQTTIMKAYNGTWYTADNPSITSWNKVSCGATITSDGTPLLVNGYHTQKQCVDAGGTVVGDGFGFNMCRFNAASCPSGSPNWTHYKYWITTGSFSTDAAQEACGNCMPPRAGGYGPWNWADAGGPGLCNCYAPIYPTGCQTAIQTATTCAQHNACNYGYWNCGPTVYPSFTQIGCY